MGYSFGSVNRTDTGYTFSRGRGAAKVSMSIDFSEIERWAKRNQAEMPRLIRKARGSAANVLMKNLYELMQAGGGLYGVPKFRDYDEFTKKWREVKGITGPMGGVLAMKKSIRKWVDGGVQWIGWPEKVKKGGGTSHSGTLAELADKFQEGRGGPDSEKWFTDSDYRRNWHRRGMADIPRAYVHNPRDVLSTYQEHVKENLNPWFRGALQKEIARMIAITKGWAKAS